MQSNTKSLSGRNRFFWGALLWTVLVAVFCLIKSEAFKGAGFLNIPYKDKYVHFVFYFVFTVLWIKAFKDSGNKSKIVAAVFCAAVSYGILIEICQALFTNSRSADFLDVLANTCGALIAVLLMRILDKK